MKRSRFTEDQIIGVSREQEAGVRTADLCRKHGISPATFYHWKAKFGGLEVSAARRLHTLEAENTRVKRLPAEACEVRPHSAWNGRTPGSIRLPPCSPGSSPLRVASGDDLRPSLTQPARDGLAEGGRDGETALGRTEKHRHEGRDGNRGLYF